MAKYAKVDKDLCISCGSCVAIAPEIFDFDEEGVSGNYYSEDKNTGTVVIPEPLETELLEAAEGCPTEAIGVQENPFN